MKCNQTIKWNALLFVVAFLPVLTISLLATPSKANAVSCLNKNNVIGTLTISGESNLGQWTAIPATAYTNACGNYPGSTLGMYTDEANDIFQFPNGSKVTEPHYGSGWPNFLPSDFTCTEGSSCPTQIYRPLQNICSISPASVSPGQVVTVSNAYNTGGWGVQASLRPASGATTVVAGTFLTTTPYFSMQFTVPVAMSTGNYSVSVQQLGSDCGNQPTLTVLSPSRTISVTKSGTGTGTVTGRGIDCGTTCSAQVADGTSVTLTEATSTGSVFSGWGGSCSGTSQTCTVTLTANTSVSAVFYSSGPTITSVSPVNNQPGSTLTIKGMNFTASGNIVSLLSSTNSVVSTQAGLSSANNITILFTIPANTHAGAYRLQVSNTNGTSDISPIGVYSTSPPTDLVATMGSTPNVGKVNLSWTDNSSNETGFTIERATDSSLRSFLPLSSTTANTTTYTDDLGTSPLNFSNEAYRVRGSFTDGTFSDYSNVASTSNCIFISGNGKRKIVFMRGDGWNTNMSGYISGVTSLINDGFGQIEPFKSLQANFSYDVDLHQIDQSMFVKDNTNMDYVDGSPAVMASSCGTDAFEYVILFGDSTRWYAWSQGRIVFMNITRMLSDDVFSLKIPIVFVHESGHAIGDLDDEYMYADSQHDATEFNGYDLIGDQRSMSMTNCTVTPRWSYTYDDGTGRRWFGSQNQVGCSYALSSSKYMTYYRPSPNSMMAHNLGYDKDAHKFNVISCGYIMAGIIDGLEKKNTDIELARPYWPVCLSMASTTGSITADGIPPFDPVTPAVSKLSANTMAPGSILAVSAGIANHDIPPADDGIVSVVDFYLNRFSKQMIAAVSGASSSIAGSGFTPTENAVKIYNSATTTEILGLTSSDTSISFTIPANLPPGQYSLKVGAFNSDWSDSVPVTITAAPIVAPTVTITAPDAASLGNPLTISWTTTSATSCTLNESVKAGIFNGYIGSVQTSGQVHLNALSKDDISSLPTTLTISCTGAGGTTSKSITVNAYVPPTVTPTPVITPTITSFTASPTSVTSGGNVTLSWTVQNASYCWGAGTGQAKTFPTTYSVVRGLLTSTTNYTLTCINSNMTPNTSTSASISVLVTVQAAAQPVMPMMVTAQSATPAVITTQAASPAVAHSITVSAGPGGYISPQGTSVAYGANQTFTITPYSGYRLSSVTVDGVAVNAVSPLVVPNVVSDHTVAATFTMTDTTNPTITTFTITPSQVVRGQPATLSWTTRGGIQNCMIDSSNNYIFDSYLGTVYGPSGSITATVPTTIGRNVAGISIPVSVELGCYTGPRQTGTYVPMMLNFTIPPPDAVTSALPSNNSSASIWDAVRGVLGWW